MLQFWRFTLGTDRPIGDVFPAPIVSGHPPGSLKDSVQLRSDDRHNFPLPLMTQSESDVSEGGPDRLPNL